jgi:hypothetical protein
MLEPCRAEIVARSTSKPNEEWLLRLEGGRGAGRVVGMILSPGSFLTVGFHGLFTNPNLTWTSQSQKGK